MSMSTLEIKTYFLNFQFQNLQKDIENEDR